MGPLYALIIDDSGSLSEEIIKREIESFKQEYGFTSGTLYVYRFVGLPRFFIRGWDLSTSKELPLANLRIKKEIIPVNVFDLIEHSLNDLKNVRRSADKNVFVKIISALNDSGSSRSKETIFDKIDTLNNENDWHIIVACGEEHNLLFNDISYCDDDYIFMHRMIETYYSADSSLIHSDQLSIIIKFFQRKIKQL